MGKKGNEKYRLDTCMYVGSYQGDHMLVRLGLSLFRMWIIQYKKVRENVGPGN